MKDSIRLQKILEASAVSQEELAHQLGVSFATLNAWVNNRAQPRAKNQLLIEQLYHEVVGLDVISEIQLTETKKKAHKTRLTVNELLRHRATLDSLILNLTYHTNTIEGSTMTLADTQAVLFENQVLTNKTQREQLEAQNHQAALLWLLNSLASGASLSEELILNLHSKLMNGLVGDAGAYRKHGVRIMGSAVATSNPQRIPENMSRLIRRLNYTPQDFITSLAKTHAQFEKIHPFSDGNGRVGRLIMLAQSLLAQTMPPLVQKERRYAYYTYLQKAQTEEQYQYLELFLAESVLFANELLLP